MVDTATDPPSDERKRAALWKWTRKILRGLVSRQTLMTALRTLTLIVRIAELLKRLFGDF